MLEKYNIKSGEDYANLIINQMIGTEREEKEENKTPIDLLNFWFEEIKILAYNTWNDYITGKRENYAFNTNEYIVTYNKACELYTQKILDGMVDKELIQVGVGENGDILYSLSEKGKDLVEQMGYTKK